MPDTDKIRSEVEAIGKYARECGMLRLEPNYADFITNIRLIVQEELATLLAPAPDWSDKVVSWVKSQPRKLGPRGSTHPLGLPTTTHFVRIRDLQEFLASELPAAPATPEPIGGTLVIVCAGGCGKTTEDVNPAEFWAGKVEQAKDPDERVPIWTCKECAREDPAAPTMGHHNNETRMDLAKHVIPDQHYHPKEVTSE